jgi:hypothetical protein
LIARSAGVVVPRNTILLKETKQRFSVAHKPLLILLRYFRGILFALNHRPVGPVDLPREFAKMFRSQSPAIDVLENRHNEIFDGQDKMLKFLIEGKLPQIVIQISNQMNPTFLSNLIALSGAVKTSVWA